MTESIGKKLHISSLARDVRRSSLTLVFGAAGGVVFFFLQMPLAWMTGAMVICTMLSLSGIKLHNPTRLRTVMFMVLGVLLGTVFSHDLLTQLPQWGLTAVFMVAFVMLVTLAIAIGLVRFARRDVNTAFFAAAPGGLTEMTILVEAYGGDTRVVALFHATRVFTTVIVFVVAFKLFAGYVPPVLGESNSATAMTLHNLAVIAGCAVLGLLVGRLLRFPAPEFLGPALLSAIVHLIGFSSASPGAWLIAAAQVVLGSSVGCRFVGYTFKETAGVLKSAVVATVFTLAVATAFAYVLQAITGQRFEALWLAFAPGGMTEMVLISYTMGIETDFVSTMHILRYLLIIAMSTIAFRWWHSRASQKLI